MTPAVAALALWAGAYLIVRRTVLLKGLTGPQYAALSISAPIGVIAVLAAKPEGDFRPAPRDWLFLAAWTAAAILFFTRTW